MEYQRTDYVVTEVHFGKAVRLPNGTTVTHIIAKNAKCKILYDGWTFRCTFDSGMSICIPTANVSQFCGDPIFATDAAKTKKHLIRENVKFEPVG